MVLINKFKFDSDRVGLSILSVLFLLPLIAEIFSIITLGHSTSYTSALYIGFVIISLIIYRNKIHITDFFILIIVYLIIGLNYLFFPIGRNYYFNTALILVYIIYLPICVFIIRKIKNWDLIFDVFKPICFVALSIAIYITIVTDRLLYADFFSYMEFSYFFLPFVAASYVILRKNFNIFYLILFVLSFYCLLSYGARQSVIFTIAFMITYELLNIYKKNPSRAIILFILFGSILLTVYINLMDILSFLVSLPGLENSRFLNHMLENELLTSHGRDVIFNRSIDYINHMGFDFDGPFGDRRINNGVWPHNIFLELLMQWGWVFGTVFIILFLIFIYKALKSQYTLVAVYFCFVVLGRYLVSGSYLNEGIFWITMFAFYTMWKNKSTKRSFKKFNLKPLFPKSN